MQVVIHCPAKVNLFLAVGPRDATGYHPVRTIMQAVGLYDTLTVAVAARDTTIRCNWPDLPAENTLTKALRLIGEAAPIPPLDIELVKRIPAGSGLGGGSSDAAGLLRAISSFLRSPMPEPLLHDIAAAIGVDVPFFLVGGRAKGEGYGERLTPLPDPPKEWYVIAKPPVFGATADAYRRLDDMSYEWRHFPDGDELYNDFERVADSSSLELIERLQAQGATGAGLTGSGSAVFGRFPSPEVAEVAASALEAEGTAQVWLAETLGRQTG